MKSNKLLKTISTAIIVAIIAFIAIALPIREIVLAESNPNNNPSTPILKIIRFLDGLLSNKTISEDSRESIELRKSYFKWQATRMAEKTANFEQIIAQKHTLAVEATKEYLLSTPIPTPSRPVGIMSGIDYDRSLEKEAKLSEIFWIGRIKETYVTVYTGVLRNDPSQGVIFVFPENVGSWLKYLTPNKLGFITIADYEGNNLTLIYENGKKIFFDVAVQKFTNSSGDNIPSEIATETPYSPYPSP